VVGFLAAAALAAGLGACSRGRQAAPGADTAAVLQPAPMAAPAAPDSVALALADLAERTRPLVASLDSAVAAIRSESGTVRADSALALFRERFELRAESVGAAVGASRVLQRWVYPVTPEGWATLDSGAADSLRRFLSGRVLQPQLGEGMLFATANSAGLAGLFGRYLSPAMREFLALRRGEEAEGFAEDAGLLISWDRLGERVATWERFIEANPGFQLLPEARHWYELYLGTLLTGMDNSRVFGGPDATLQPQVRASYRRFAARHGSTRAGAMVSEYLGVLERNGFQDGPAVRAFLRDRGVATMIGVQPPTR